MSSSRGLGATARHMADLLPPEILRFLMVKSQPNKPVNFVPEEKYIVKLFNKFDRYQQLAHKIDSKEEIKRIYQLSEIKPEEEFYQANFQLVVTLVQMPHLDIHKQVETHKKGPLTPLELKHLNQRIESAKYWVENLADENEKTRLQETLPEQANELNNTQKAFLNLLAQSLNGINWEDDTLQTQIFETTRMTPIKQSEAFQAIYRVLLDRDSGPKAGNLLAFLESDFVIQRFGELSYSESELWNDTAISENDFTELLEQQKENISSLNFDSNTNTESNSYTSSAEKNKETNDNNFIIEIIINMNDHKAFLKRVKLLIVDSEDKKITRDRFIEDINKKFDLSVSVDPIN